MFRTMAIYFSHSTKFKHKLSTWITLNDNTYHLVINKLLTCISDPASLPNQHGYHSQHK